MLLGRKTTTNKQTELIYHQQPSAIYPTHSGELDAKPPSALSYSNIDLITQRIGDLVSDKNKLILA